MNENKTKLILMIATRLSDEQCAAILSRIEESPEIIANKLIHACGLANNKAWDESEHPRAEDGKFAPGGSMRGSMTKGEQRKWDKEGRHTPAAKVLTAKRAEIRKLEKKLDDFREGSYAHTMTRGEIEKAKRELSELIRDVKAEKRMVIESDVTKRIMRKKADQFYDIDEEIDYMEEHYADRDSNSPTQGELKWPKGKRGEKARAKYEELRKRKADLEDEIEWDLIEEEE